MQIVKEVYRCTGSFPKSEQFGLTNQMRRASVSIPSNIAEGHIKNQTGDFLRFLSIAIGSCAELETQILIANELGWLKEDSFKTLIELMKSEIRQANALKRRLTESRIPNPES